MERLGYVRGIGQIVESCGNFYSCLSELYSCLSELYSAGADVITPEQELEARVRTAGKKDIGKSNGTFTACQAEYAKGEIPLLRLLRQGEGVLNLETAREVVEADKNNKYFSIDSTKEYEFSLKQFEEELSQGKRPWELSVLPLLSRDNFKITFKQKFYVLQFLTRNPKAEFKSKNKRINYFEFNGSKPIQTYLVNRDDVDTQTGTIIVPLWLSFLGCGSGFYARHVNLDFSGRVRWVLKETGEASRV